MSISPFTSNFSVTSLEPFPRISEDSDLPSTIHDVANKVLDGGIREGDIFVLACKPVSIVEHRCVFASELTPSAEALELDELCEHKQSLALLELIVREARPGKITVIPSRAPVRAQAPPMTAIVLAQHRRGYGPLMYAGVDRDWRHDEEAYLLLPDNPDKSAMAIRNELILRSGIRKLGVVISDSEVLLDRAGSICIALGSAGLDPQRATPNDYPSGRSFESMVDILANVGAVTIGQQNRMAPVAVIRGIEFDSSEDLGVLDIIRDADTS